MSCHSLPVYIFLDLVKQHVRQMNSIAYKLHAIVCDTARLIDAQHHLPTVSDWMA